jgi:methylmalonyl-CoA/ethylmalonyl-CoA epimerase
MPKIEHIGIAVKDLNEAIERFSKLLNTSPYKTEKVESEEVSTVFFKTGEGKIELLESTDPNGPIGKYISKKGEGIHHIAFDVDDIHSEMERLKGEGFDVIGDIREGADNKLVCFIHPKSANGVLIELCQDKNTD